MQKKKKFRMSGPVVVIGFLLLVPSVLGMLLGGFLLLATGVSAGTVNTQTSNEARQSLIAAGLSEAVAEKALHGRLTEAEKSALTDQQKTAVRTATNEIAAGAAGTGIAAVFGGGIALFFIVSSFIGGLLGWLLIMRKKVLQCVRCEAVVAAS